MPKYTLSNLTFRLPQPVKKIIPFALFFVAISINIYFRLFPAYFPQLKQQAKLNVENKIIESIAQKVENTYPEFNTLIKKKIILKAFEEDKKTKAGFKKEIKDEYEKLKNPYQDAHGQTYMLEVDGYQWTRYVENILKNGHPGDSLKGGDPYDDYMDAPVGRVVVRNQLFFYLSAYLFQFTAFFLKNISLAALLFYLPLFYAFLFLSLVYLAVRTFFSDTAAFFSTLFIGLNRQILSHTCVGWFDYDSLVFSLPLLIVFLLSLSFKKEYSIKKRTFYSMLAASAVAIYAGIWIAFWWIFSICAAYYLYAILNAYSLDKKAHKEALTYLLLSSVFFITTQILCALILKINILEYTFLSIKETLHLGTSQQISIWPYTFYTVGELVKTNPEQIIQNLGGPVIAIFATIGALCVYIKEKRTKKQDFVILTVFWLFVMCFAASKSLRFIAFLAIPLGIFFGAFIDAIFKYISAKFRIHPQIFFLVLSLFIVFIFWSGKTLINTGYLQAKSIYPLMNDSWYKALVYIQKNTPKNSIINSWWDYGNFFKTISGRRVIFDPQSQQTTMAYWMAEVLLENDENRSLNILKMLNNSSDTIFDQMQVEIKDDFQCIELLKKILGSNKKEAEKILEKQNISNKLKNKIIETIFLKEPVPAYFVLDKGMIYKMYNISFLGNWNFSKVYINKNRSFPKAKIIDNLVTIFSLSKEQAESAYGETIVASTEEELSEVISKRFSFFFVTDKQKQEGGLVYFNNGIILNLSDFTARVLAIDKGYKKYKNVFIYDNKNLNVYENKDTDYNESIFFLKKKNGWCAVGLSKELAESLFLKLYFLDGTGLKYFEPFYADDDAGIYVYKIKWQKSE